MFKKSISISLSLHSKYHITKKNHKPLQYLPPCPQIKALWPSKTITMSASIHHTHRNADLLDQKTHALHPQPACETTDSFLPLLMSLALQFLLEEPLLLSLSSVPFFSSSSLLSPSLCPLGLKLEDPVLHSVTILFEQTL